MAQTLASPKSCVIYCRVSSKKQKKDETITAQRERCMVLVERHGLVPIPYGPHGDGIIEDNGVSGTLLEGRSLAKLVDDLRYGRIRVDYLVVYSLSRISRVDKVSKSVEKQVRSAEDAAKIVAVLRAIGVMVVDESGSKDPNQFGFEAEMMVGNEQHKIIRQSTMTGKASRLERGQAAMAGKPRYGYARVLANGVNRADGWEMKPHVTEAPNLVRIFTWYVEGGATHAARMATEAAIPTPQAAYPKHKNASADWSPTRWAAVTIERLVDQVAMYATGVISGTFDGKPYQVAVPNLVPYELWQKVERKQREGTIKGKVVYLSTGHLRCTCGAMINNRSFASGSYHQTRCIRCRAGIRQADFDRRLEEAVECRLVQIVIHEKAEAARDDRGERIRAIDARIVEVQQRIARLWEAHESDELDHEVWKTKNAERNAEKLALVGERTKLVAEAEAAAKREVQRESLAARVTLILDEMRDATVTRRREVLSEILLGDRIGVAWRRDDEGNVFAEVTLPAWGTLAPMIYRTDQRVAAQVWTEAERASPHWNEILEAVEHHDLRRFLEEMFVEEMPAEWGPAPNT